MKDARGLPGAARPFTFSDRELYGDGRISHAAPSCANLMRHLNAPLI